MYSAGEDSRNDLSKGNRSNMKKRGGSNAKVNITGFHNNFQGGKGSSKTADLKSEGIVN